MRRARGRAAAEDRERLGDLSAVTLHRLLGWLPRSSRPVPARRGQPAAARHRGGRRDVDGVADPDGSAAGGGTADRAADAGRRPGPAVLGGGRRGAGRHRPGARAPDAGWPSGWPSRCGWTAAARPVHGVVQLTHTWRFGQAIDALARGRSAAGTPTRCWPCCGPASSDVRFIEVDLRAPTPARAPTPLVSALAGDVQATGAATLAAARAGDVPARPGRPGPAPAAVRPPARAVRGGPVEHRGRALAGRGHARLRRGRRVVSRPAAAGDGQRLRDGPVQRRHRRHRATRRTGSGRPSPAGPQPTLFAPVRLDAVQTVHAMTVHRAQGSQFERVSFVVPPPTSPLLTRELLYTAVTRANRPGAGDRHRGGRPAGRRSARPTGPAACATA